ncbi:MAG: 30S ribosomal protein S18 [Deltaproteobacteria bacterium]|nr:30S ribosomal protein S18 [Deltaproteobacteria bacterium]
MADMEKDDREERGYRGGRDRDDRDDRGGKDDDEKGGRRSFHRKKVCRFCADNEYIMDYKDARQMQQFVMDLGKIVPRRISGTCAFHQRKVTTAVKRARNLALIGFITSGPQDGYSSR